MSELEKLRVCLLTVVSSVTYGTNEYDNDNTGKVPFIVYQVINKRAPVHVDDKPSYFETLVQISLVTKNKELSKESSLENALLTNGYNFVVSSEYLNSDKSICRVYEVRLEEF